MLAFPIIAFALVAGALVVTIRRGLALRPDAIWWIATMCSVGTMAFGALAITIGATAKHHVVVDGVRHGLGGPGPLIALVFGVVLWLLGAVGAYLLYVGLPRARLIAARRAAEEAEARATIARLPGG